MIPLEDLRNRDKGLYWNGTVIFDKVKGRACYLSELHDVAVVQPIGGGQIREYSLKEFSQRFLAHRIPLGWINCHTACMYGSSTPGRGNRKAYTYQDVKVYSPVHEAASSIYVRIKHRVREKDPFFERGIPKELEAAQEMLFSLNSLKPQAMKYFSSYNENFYSLYDAARLLSRGERMGCALNLSWALVFTATNREDECSVYYHDSVVGSYNFNKGVQFDEGHEELTSAWSRL